MDIFLSEELIQVAPNFIIVSFSYCIAVSIYIVAVSMIDDIVGSSNSVSIADDDVSSWNHMGKERNQENGD